MRGVLAISGRASETPYPVAEVTIAAPRTSGLTPVVPSCLFLVISTQQEYLPLLQLSHRVYAEYVSPNPGQAA